MYNYRHRLGVDKRFSLRAASTIFRVVEGQGLLSRTAGCCKRNCISSKVREMSSQCGISGRKNGGVPKKKRLSHFRRRQIRGWGKVIAAFAPFQSPCRIYFNMAKFQNVFAGRTECSRGPHAARVP